MGGQPRSAEHEQPAPGTIAPAPALPERLLSALAGLAGAQRGVLYDVAPADAPRRVAGSPIYLHHTPAWRRFMALRARVDDGEGAMIMALRPLPTPERRLVVDWGARFPNTFLLVEPADPGFDLTRTATISATATRMEMERWLRAAAWRWVQWCVDSPGAQRLRPLDVGAGQTIISAITRIATEEYAAPTYAAMLAALVTDEPELLQGRPAARAVVPFRTRLGMAPPDPAMVMGAVRSLVNDGRMWVYEPRADGRAFRGPSRVLPASMSDAELAPLVIG